MAAFSNDETVNSRVRTESGRRRLNELDFCNAFWRPNLSFNPFTIGDKPRDFESLWPKSSEKIRQVVQDIFELEIDQTEIRLFCLIVLRCGPVKVLKCLVESNFIDIDSRFGQADLTLLHLACVSRNLEAASYLCNTYSHLATITDKNGQTPGQICTDIQIKKLMVKNGGLPQKQVKKKPASTVQKMKIFELVKDVDSDHHEHILLLLQTLDFDVNLDTNTEGDTLLHTTIKQGMRHLPLAIYLVTKGGADVNVLNRDGLTCISVTAARGDVLLTELLVVVLGADPNICNPKNGWSPLHYSVFNKHMEAASCLVRRGANVNVECQERLRPDDLGRYHGFTDCLQLFSQKRLSRAHQLTQLIVEDQLTDLSQMMKTDLVIVNRDGMTPLMVAAQYNRIEILKLLLQDDSCPVNALNSETGQTALCMTAKEGHEEVVKLLVESKGDPRIKDLGGYLPLHYACMRSHYGVVKAILDPNMQLTGLTGLPAALKLSSAKLHISELVVQAMRHRQTVVVNPVLFESAVTGHSEKLFNVLEDGDDVNPETGSGDWPLYLATENGHLDVVTLLYEFGGDVGRCHPTSDASLLHVACARGHLPVVQFLLRLCRLPGLPRCFGREEASSCYKELDLNAINLQGLTPLQEAARKGHIKIVESLLAMGANCGILDSEGGGLYQCTYEGVQTLLDVHRRNRMKRIVMAILDRKRGLHYLTQIWEPRFDHNLHDSNGDSPLMIACAKGRLEVVKFLLDSVWLESPNRTLESSNGTSFEEDSPEWTDAFNTSSDPDGQIEIEVSEMFHQQSLRTSTPIKDFTRSLVKQKSPFKTRSSSFNESWDSMQFQGSFPAAARMRPASVPARNLFGDQDSELTNRQFSEKQANDKLSAVCMVNAQTGQTALHKVAHCSKEKVAVQLAKLLVSKDRHCVNMADAQGFTPLHTAAQKNRKQIVRYLVSLPYADLNMRTCTGKLAGELTSSNTIKKIFEEWRTQHNEALQSQNFPPSPSIVSTTSSGIGGNSIDLEALAEKFKELHQQDLVTTNLTK